MKGQWIKDLAPGTVSGLFKVKDAALKTTRKGSSYIDAILIDKTGSIPCKVWDAAAADMPKWKHGALLEIKGRAEKYRDRLQVVVDSAAPADSLIIEDEAFEDASPFSLEELKSGFKEVTGGIEDPDLSALVKAVFGDKAVWERFSTWPAAMQYHHAYRHGLLEHTLSMAKIAIEIARSTGRLDMDYLLTGALLHDIGKIYELTGVAPYDYSDRGRLMGHIYMGAELVKEKASGLDDFPDGKLERVLHMVLSHHGEPAFGSPVRPTTPEAVTLHYIDNIDAKLQAANFAIERDQTPGAWTDYMRMFETRLFKGTPE